MTTVRSETYDLILPWWLRDGVRPEPKSPLQSPACPFSI